jgi:hypothetical protein
VDLAQWLASENPHDQNRTERIACPDGIDRLNP